MLYTLTTPIKSITSIGKKVAPSLKELGIETAQDLIFYFPFRWEDWRDIKPIGSLEEGTMATIKGKLELIQNKRSKWKKRLVTEAIISDDSGSIKAVWFHSPYLTKNLIPGDILFLSGKVEEGPIGLQFVHPIYEKESRRKKATTHTARIIPIYSLTSKLTQKQIRYLISQVIRIASRVKDFLPYQIKKEYKLVSLPIALQQIHFPYSKKSLEQAQHRLKFNELFLIQLKNLLAKRELGHLKAYKIEFKEKETKKFVQNLPFKLTEAQRKTSWEILKDFSKEKPMNRLLEGDVGSGKTIVAVIAILNVVLNKYQVAYMAPTEILAKQHFENLTKLLKDFPIKIALLTRTAKKINNPSRLGHKSTFAKDIKKSDLIKKIQEGKINLIIGTHALIQEKISFKNLTLAIVDEQHRFGVEQRKKLHQKSSTCHLSPITCHFLSMTATPIPRSLALTLYGDLDLSILDEMPKGRKKIITKIVPPDKRGETYRFIREEIKKGRQCFVICPLIDPSDKLGVKAATEEYVKVSENIFPEMKVDLLHGRLKSQEKEEVMEKFLKNRINILVATPVVEVGIDVPNATVMIIEGAERFGLAGLHQFRGRVGRSKYQSYCFLFTESKTTETRQRLQALITSENGFDLAEKDLEFRGPGEVYGVKQSGFLDELKIAKLTDWPIIKEAKEVAEKLVSLSPSLDKYPELQEKMAEFEASIHLE